MSKLRIDRRTALRGFGTALALPWLEAMVPTKLIGATAPTAPPTRMAFFFVPNGVRLPHWTPTKEGFDYDLPSILEPLRRVRDDVLVLSGLTHDKGRANGDGAGDHARAASVFLTGRQPFKTPGANVRVGVSVDQVAASVIGKHTRFASLELGCDRGRDSGQCDSGYSCAYSNNISWRSESTPMAKEIDPRQLFDRLFAAPDPKEAEIGRLQRDRLRKSVLDFVLDDAKRLEHRIGRSDRRKLDEYLTGVRQIERRIELASRATPSQPVDFDRPNGIPEDFGGHIRLLGDVMLLAFRTDATRVATFMVARAGSNRSYGSLGVPEGHHELSHHGGNETKHEKLRKIDRYHVEQLAYLLERMKATPEGEGTLLDHSMILYGSGISDGNRHNNEDLPILLAGRGGGTIVSGRHLRFERETPMCNLFLSMLDRVGATVPRFGDSTGRLPYLTG